MSSIFHWYEIVTHSSLNSKEDENGGFPGDLGTDESAEHLSVSAVFYSLDFQFPGTETTLSLSRHTVNYNCRLYVNRF